MNISLQALAPLIGFASIVLSGCHSTSPPSNDNGRSDSDSLDRSSDSASSQSHVRGIDVSDNVGAVDWGKVVAAGYTFAFVKATDGVHYSNADYFYDNWPKMKAAGIIRGAYHFYESDDDPVAQANYFVGVLEKAGGLGKNDLPPVLDFERATSGSNVLKFLQTLKAKTGRTPIIYVNESFASSYLTNPAFAAYPLWLAEYGVDQPKVPTTWAGAGRSWTFWQNSEDGKVPGVSGSGQTDLDKFNGTLNDLKEFVRKF